MNTTLNLILITTFVFMNAVTSYSDDNNKANYYSNRAGIYFNNGDYNKAITEYSSALKYSPKNEIIYLNRGNSYFNLKKYDKAISDLSKVISINPNTSDAWNNRGRAYWVKGQKNKAIKDFEEACKMLGNRMACENLQDITEEGQSAEFFYNTANNYFYSRDYIKAMKYFNQSIRKNDKYYDSYIGRGKIHFYTEGGFSIVGSHPQALNDLNTAISIDPNRVEGYMERGKVYATDSYYKGAIDDYTHALDLDSNNAKAQYNLAIAISNFLNSTKQFENLQNWESWESCRSAFTKSCNLGYSNACKKLNQFNDGGYLYGTFNVDE